MESFDETLRKRREAVAHSLRLATTEDLHKVGESLFGSPTHPWHKPFHDFVATHQASDVLFAEADGLAALYVPVTDQGLWFMTSDRTSGGGPLPERGKQVFRELAREKGLVS